MFDIIHIPLIGILVPFKVYKLHAELQGIGLISSAPDRQSDASTQGKSHEEQARGSAVGNLDEASTSDSDSSTDTGGPSCMLCISYIHIHICMYVCVFVSDMYGRAQPPASML